MSFESLRQAGCSDQHPRLGDFTMLPVLTSFTVEQNMVQIPMLNLRLCVSEPHALLYSGAWLQKEL